MPHGGQCFVEFPSKHIELARQRVQAGREALLAPVRERAATACGIAQPIGEPLVCRERPIDRFDAIFSKLKNRGKITERDIDEVAREIRVALLEADVNVTVVKAFIARIKEQAIGADLSKSLSPAQSASTPSYQASIAPG